MTTHSASSAFPPPSLSLSLSDPVWRVEHVAGCFGVSTDTALQYAARVDFPPARQVSGTGGRLLWLPADILEWFAKLPGRDATARRRACSVEAASQPARPVRPYRPRTRKAA